MINATDCIGKDFDTVWQKKWASIIGPTWDFHAKAWEQAVIAQALEDRGCLSTNKKGLGMGVGREELVSIFAASGAKIVATDLNPSSGKADQWDNGQLAAGKSSLFFPHIINKKTFENNVTFENFNMNEDEKRYRNNFDFIWHNCVIGHLGSTEKSIKHLERSAKYLKNDGWLIFTTELNISSLDTTVSDNSDTIIWRLKDIDTLYDRLAKVGLYGDNLNLRLGSMPGDLRMNYSYTPSFGELTRPEGEFLIKIPFSNFALTQIVLCFKKTNKPVNLRGRKLKQKIVARRNKAKLLSHVKQNSDLKDYYRKYKNIDYARAAITPLKSSQSIKLKAGATKVVEIIFRNDSAMPVFSYCENTPYSAKAIVLSTADPVNRPSSFYHKSWFSENRPTVEFIGQNKSGKRVRAPYRARPEEYMKYSFTIKAPKKTGKYKEIFCPVFEGICDLADKSSVTLNITVN